MNRIPQPPADSVTAEQLITIVDDNKKREAHLSRMPNSLSVPYTNEKMLEMYGPYLRDFSHEDLTPREARLIETWFRDFRSVFSLQRANAEYDAAYSKERNKGFELQKANDSLAKQSFELQKKIDQLELDKRKMQEVISRAEKATIRNSQDWGKKITEAEMKKDGENVIPSMLAHDMRREISSLAGKLKVCEDSNELLIKANDELRAQAGPNACFEKSKTTTIPEPYPLHAQLPFRIENLGTFPKHIPSLVYRDEEGNVLFSRKATEIEVALCAIWATIPQP